MLHRVLSVSAAVFCFLSGILSFAWSVVFLVLGGPNGNLSLGESIVLGFSFLAFATAVIALGAWLLRLGRKADGILKRSQQAGHAAALKMWLRVTAAILFVAVLAPLARHALRSRGQPIENYVRFLEKQKQTPVDYILSLFGRYDIVVLCERPHPEVTQYDMIFELASDPRFREQVGHIFTELGTSALQPFLESFLTDEQLTDKEVTERLCYLARNFCGYPVWDRSNVFDFLGKLYYLNRSLPKDRRIHVYPTDIDFRWDTATKESFAEYSGQLGRRDRIEAINVVSKFNAIRQHATRNKALVIMNYRHAFSHLRKSRFELDENTAGFLMDAYPGRVANVMINSVVPLPGSTSARAVITALQQGKWDAAFALVGDPSVGFDFAGSPLGGDSFDYFPFIRTRLRYQDVFTGFVFFRPLQEQRLSFGLPGLIDQSFTDELLRRYRITGENRTRDEVVREIALLQRARISTYEDDTNVISRSDCAVKIRQWLKGRP